MKTPRRHIQIDGARVAWSERGSGPAVVLIHGTLTALEDGLLALGDALESAGFRVIAFDRPGCGESDGGPLDASIWAQARRLAAATRALGLDRPTLLGQSQGATVALAWAALFPQELAGVIAVAPIAVPEPRLEQLVFGPRAVFGTGDALSYAAMPLDGLLMPLLWRALFAPQAVPEPFRSVFPVDQAGERGRLKRAGEEALHLAPDLSRLVAALPGVPMPIRVFQGDRDLVVNPLHARTVAGLAPDGLFTSLPGLGHMAHHFAAQTLVEAVRSLSAHPASAQPFEASLGL